MAETDCKLHQNQIGNLEIKMQTLEQNLETIRVNIHTLLGRSGDIVVKVINGKTEERLASELIGEMYVEMKSLKKQTPKSLYKGLGVGLIPLINLLTIIGLIITIFALKG